MPLDELTGGLASAPANNDYMLVFYSCTGSRVNPIGLDVGETGWTELAYLDPDDAVDARFGVYGKFSDGTDTDVGISATGHTEAGPAVAVLVLRGVNTVTPLDVAVETAEGINGSQPDPPPITPSTDGALIVVAGAAGAISNGGFTSSDLDSFFEANTQDSWDSNVGVGIVTGKH